MNAYRTVSHTLESALSDRLRTFAFNQRLSESAVIERALRWFFERGDEATLGELLRSSGERLRRR